MSRKAFLRGFASLVAYTAPAVVVLETLGCSTGGAPTGSSDGGGTNCSFTTSVSCSSVSVSTAPDAG